MSIKIHEISSAFPQVLKLVRSTPQADVRHLRAPENADARSLIFVSSPEHLRTALKSPARAWVVTPALEGEVPERVENLLVASRVPLAMALIAKRFFANDKGLQIVEGERIHPSAIIAASATLGTGCRIGPGAVIGERVVIGKDCFIGANAVIEPEVQIGERTRIHPLVFIGHSCILGADCEVKSNSTIGTEGFGYAQDEQFNHHRITHYGRVILEDRVHIGAGVQIDRGTYLDSRIGSGTKIDNHCHFGHNIVIGKNTLITGGMLAAGSTTIGNYCVFGGRTTIKGHLEIGDRIQIAGISAVGKSMSTPGEYGGFPLQDIKSEMRTRASLKSLPLLVKQVRRILKHLGLEAE